jgi:putative transposase
LAKAEWLAARRAEVLPVEYFHITFTLPSQLGPVALQNQAVLFDLLFKAVSQTLLRIAADPKHLGARIGFFAVLHTWGQTLTHHPHLHCVVPGGGLSQDGTQWVGCRSGFFLPVRVLSRFFRRLFLQGLRQAFQQGRLQFHGHLQHLADPLAFQHYLKRCRATDWVVHSKSHFGSPERAIEYLAHYTHKVAISNHRLLSLQNGRITFRYKDYRDPNISKLMTISADEFIRRFLLHVLPHGFMRIRYYGFLGNSHRATNLAACRSLLALDPQPLPELTSPDDFASRYQSLTGHQLDPCPACKKGSMSRIRFVPPLQPLSITPPIPDPPDTS